jgi:hypothetical protein
MALSELDQDYIRHLSVGGLKIEFQRTMDSMEGNTNLCSLADLAQYASALWIEMNGRGVEWK